MKEQEEERRKNHLKPLNHSNTRDSTNNRQNKNFDKRLISISSNPTFVCGVEVLRAERRSDPV